MLTDTVNTEPIIARQLFDPITHEAIKHFLDERVPMLALGTPMNTDDEMFVRNYAHNVPFLVAIHNQLTEFASDMFKVKLKPSYVFLSMYKEGGTCPLHIDRPQCFRTIDYLIRQSEPEPWPIHIADYMPQEQRDQHDEDNDGHPDTPELIQARIDAERWNEILLEPNDAVLYSGTHQWHYRPTALKGTADLVFFHFVEEDFDGPLN